MPSSSILHVHASLATYIQINSTNAFSSQQLHAELTMSTSMEYVYVLMATESSTITV